MVICGAVSAAAAAMSARAGRRALDVGDLLEHAAAREPSSRDAAVLACASLAPARSLTREVSRLGHARGGERSHTPRSAVWRRGLFGRGRGTGECTERRRRIPENVGTRARRTAASMIEGERNKSFLNSDRGCGMIEGDGLP
eukprot:1435335-Prymnesium_polylepis.1